MRRAAIILAIAGCGGDTTPPPAPPVRAIGGDLIDPGAGSGDAIVARVNGRPVWASCVAGHVRARGITVDRAVDACIDLELLAAAALERGLAAEPETQDALRTALVDGFVGEEFEDRYRSPADLPRPILDAHVAHKAGELDRREQRNMVYARAKVPLDQPAGSAADVAAKAFADEIYAELGKRDDLFPDDLFSTAKRLAAGRPLETAVPRPGALENTFGLAAYTVPGIGQLSPPTRTPWGWDLILITDLRPARKITPDQLIAEDFLAIVRWFFDHAWFDEIATRHAVERFPDRLADPDEPVAPAGSGTPR